MKNTDPGGSCPGRTCDWLKAGYFYCVNGSKGECFVANLLEANESDFHDRKLIEATRQIKSVLKNLRSELDDGRELSFIVTDLGILLAWVMHGKTPDDLPDDPVTSDSDRQTIIENFNLNVEPSPKDKAESVCRGRFCDWLYFDEKIHCVPGTKHGCLEATFLEAEESDFHTADLAKASSSIRDIIENIPKDEQNRKLSLVSTFMGLLLAWVHPGDPDSGKGAERISSDSEDEKIIKALNLSV